jgi:hypothetical protein
VGEEKQPAMRCGAAEMCDVSMGSRVAAHPSSTWPPPCGCRVGHPLGDARVGRAALPACLKLFRRVVFAFWCRPSAVRWVAGGFR